MVVHWSHVVDTPEITHAKTEHAAPRIKEKNILAHQAAQSAEHIVSYESPVLASYAQHLTIAKIVPAAPIGYNSHVVDTSEVAYVKAEHAAAYWHEKLQHGKSAGKLQLSIPHTPMLQFTRNTCCRDDPQLDWNMPEVSRLPPREVSPCLTT